MKLSIKIIIICFYVLVVQDTLANAWYFNNATSAVDASQLSVKKIIHVLPSTIPSTTVGLKLADAAAIENNTISTGGIGGTGNSPTRTGGIGGTGNSAPTGGIGGTGLVPLSPDFADIPHIPDIPEAPGVPDLPGVPIDYIPDIPMSSTSGAFSGAPDIPE